MPKKENWRLILDGKKYTEGTFEEGITLAAYLCFPVKTRVKNTICGFTNQNVFLEWATREGIGEVVENGIRRVAMEKKKLEQLTESQIEKLESDQAKKVKEETAAVDRKLKQKGVLPGDTKKLLELARKGEIGSVYLYDYTGYRGPRLYLSVGLYRKLSRFGWNDRAASGIDTSAGGGTWLFQHTYFLGVPLFIPPLCGIPDFLWFKNRASSAIVLP